MSQDKFILLEQVKLVNKSLGLTLLTTGILGGVLFIEFYNDLSLGFVITYSVLWLISFLFRSYVLIRKNQTPPNKDNIRDWMSINNINMAISAAMYGFAGCSIFFIKDQLSITIIYVILAGVTAGGVSYYAPIKNLPTIFITIVTTPLIVSNFWLFDLNHLILGVITTLYAFVVISTANNLHQTLLNTLKQKIAIKTLTQQKTRIEENSKIKNQFFASMSHEIRTPLNGITGLVDLLLKGDLNSEQLDYLSTIKRSSDDLLQVINDVLDISKIESEKLKILPKQVNLKDFNKRMITLFKGKANGKNIGLNLIESADLPTFIEADELRLSQVVSNLLSNAIKFTQSGGVVLSVKLIDKVNSSAQIQFKIEDSGIGIPLDKIAFIFNRYDQIIDENISIDANTGTGLGLSIAKKLVNLMGSELEVKSVVNKGSSFWFTLNLNAFENDKELLQQQTSFTPNKQFNINVLLVDDKDVNLKVAKLMLIKLGCSVSIANSGELAIDIYNSKPHYFDLIMMDIQMPIMNGIETTQALLHKYREALCPVVCLTAQTKDNLENKEDLNIFASFLLKPITISSLEDCLSEIF